MVLEVYKARSNKEKVDLYKLRLAQVLGKEKVAESSGDIVNQLHRLCSSVTESILEKLQNEFQNQESVTHQLQEWMGIDSGVNLAVFAAGIQKVFENKPPDRSLSWFGEQVKSAVELTVFKGFVLLIEKIPVENRNPPETVLFKAIELLLKPAADHFPKLIDTLRVETESYKARLQEEGQPVIEKEMARYRETFATEQVKPFIDEILAVLFNDDVHQLTFKHHLPLPTEIQELGAGVIKNQLSSFFGQLLASSTSWMHENEKHEQDLTDIFYESDEPLKFCHVLGEMVGPGIAYLCREKKESLSKDISSVLAPNQSPEALDQLKKMIGGVLGGIGARQSEPVNQLMFFANRFVESIIIRMVFFASKKIQSLESLQKPEEPSILEKAVLQVMNRLQEHFQGITKTKSAIKKPKNGKIKRSEFVKKFHELIILHPAAENEKGKLIFSQDLARDLLRFLGSKHTTLPLPTIIQSPFWKALEDKIIPAFFSSILEDASDPKNLNDALLSLVDKINLALEDDPKVRLKFKDPFQHQLAAQAGEITKSLVNLQPSKLPRFLINRDKVKAAAGTAIAEGMRQGLRVTRDDPLSIITVLNTVFKLVAQQVQTHQWNSATKTFEVLKEGKEVSFEKGPDFTFMFPETLQQIAEVKKLKAEQKKIGEKELPKKVGKIISNETNRKITELYDKLWALIETVLDEMIVKIFKSYAFQVRQVIVPAANVLIGLPLWISLTIIRYLIWSPMRSVVNFYIRGQTEARAKDVSLDIHDNAILHLASDLKEFLKQNDASLNPT